MKRIFIITICTFLLSAAPVLIFGINSMFLIGEPIVPNKYKKDLNDNLKNNL